MCRPTSPPSPIFDEPNEVSWPDGKGGNEEIVAWESAFGTGIPVGEYKIVLCGTGFAKEPGECIGDFTGDQVVDAADLATLLGHWNTADRETDPDNSGTVDAADLAILLGNWGPC